MKYMIRLNFIFSSMLKTFKINKKIQQSEENKGFDVNVDGWRRSQTLGFGPNESDSGSETQRVYVI